MTFELARRVGPSGPVIGLDLDEVKLAIDAASLVYARLVLTHLVRPEHILARARAALVRADGSSWKTSTTPVSFGWPRIFQVWGQRVDGRY